MSVAVVGYNVVLEKNHTNNLFLTTSKYTFVSRNFVAVVPALLSSDVPRLLPLQHALCLLRCPSVVGVLGSSPMMLLSSVEECT